MIEILNSIELESKNSGRAMITIKHENDSITKINSANMILDTFQSEYILNRDLIATSRIRFGTGSKVVEATDTSLDVPVEFITPDEIVREQNHFFDGDNLTGHFGFGYNIKYRFSPGQYVGYLSELGLETDNEILITRLLLKDQLGDPTSVDIIETDILEINYEFRFTWPRTTQIQNINLLGTDYEIKIESFTGAESLGSSPSIPNISPKFITEAPMIPNYFSMKTYNNDDDQYRKRFLKVVTDEHDEIADRRTVNWDLTIPVLEPYTLNNFKIYSGINGTNYDTSKWMAYKILDITITPAINITDLQQFTIDGNLSIQF